MTAMPVSVVFMAVGAGSGPGSQGTRRRPPLTLWKAGALTRRRLSASRPLGTRVRKRFGLRGGSGRILFLHQLQDPSTRGAATRLDTSNPAATSRPGPHPSPPLETPVSAPRVRTRGHRANTPRRSMARPSRSPASSSSARSCRSSTSLSSTSPCPPSRRSSPLRAATRWPTPPSRGQTAYTLALATVIRSPAGPGPLRQPSASTYWRSSSSRLAQRAVRAMGRRSSAHRLCALQASGPRRHAARHDDRPGRYRAPQRPRCADAARPHRRPDPRGYLIEHHRGTWIFIINLPIGIRRWRRRVGPDRQAAPSSPSTGVGMLILPAWRRSSSTASSIPGEGTFFSSGHHPGTIGLLWSSASSSTASSRSTRCSTCACSRTATSPSQP